MTYTTLGVELAQNETLAAIEKEAGPNNFLRVMSLQPELLEAFLKLDGLLLESSTIDRRIKEMVYLAVSYVNEAAYCTAHHEKNAREAGLTDDEIHDIKFEINRSFSDKERAVLQYTRDLTRTANADRDIRYRAQEHFTNEQFVELTAIVGMANFTNRFNNGLAVPLEHSSVG